MSSLSKDKRRAKRLKQQEKSYFNGYADLDCHLMMLLDRPRTDAYRHAIMETTERLRNKVVLDVGAGTGILSIFACQAGAARVHAVEASSVYRELAEIVYENKCDKKVVVHHTRIEELQLDEKVDCIISEWMGYALFCEWMLKSVLVARDRFLQPGGLMIPDRARLYIAPITLTDCLYQRTRQWYNVRDNFNVNMDFISRIQQRNCRGRVFVHSIDPTEVVGRSSKVIDLNLYTVTEDDLHSLEGKFSCECYGSCLVYGFCLWFDVQMPQDIVLDTSPYKEQTHWQQVALYVRPFEVDQGKFISGSFAINQHPVDHRDFCVTIQYKYEDQPSRAVNFRDWK